MTIARILAQKPAQLISARPDQSLQEAAAILTDKRIGALLVLDDAGKLVGILSERDIVRICAEQGDKALASPISAAMTAKLMTASPSDTVDNALARMTDRRIRHLPILDNEKLVGLASIGDLVKAKIDEALAEADAMRAYIATG
jgi:CBS domain-containing protein